MMMRRQRRRSHPMLEGRRKKTDSTRRLLALPREMNHVITTIQLLTMRSEYMLSNQFILYLDRTDAAGLSCSLSVSMQT